MHDLIWLIPALPLAGFAFLAFFGKRLGEPAAGWVATLAVGASFLTTVGVYLSLLGEDHTERAYTQTLFTWLPVGGLSVDFGFLADPLSGCSYPPRTSIHWVGGRGPGSSLTVRTSRRPP